MKKFTRTEQIVTSFIFIVVFTITFVNLKVALRRSRDSQRRSDIGAIADALNAFHENYGFFPLSENGKIKLCRSDNFKSVMDDISDDDVFDRNKFFSGLKTCDWGASALEDVISGGNSYLGHIPADPRPSVGSQYYYLSNSEYFQIYAYLEGEKTEDTYNASIVARNLPCGNKICSVGKSYLDIPLDKSIEQYMTEMSEKNKQKQK